MKKAQKRLNTAALRQKVSLKTVSPPALEEPPTGNLSRPGPEPSVGQTPALSPKRRKRPAKPAANLAQYVPPPKPRVSRVHLTVLVSEELRNLLKIASVTTHKPMHQLITEAIHLHPDVQPFLAMLPPTEDA